MPSPSQERRGAELQLDRVTRLYGSVAAVRELSIIVGRGEFLTLLGASGSGKTTTLNLLAGFDQPSAGRILLNGQDVTPLPPYRRQLGVVFQSYALFPHMTVFGNIAFPLKMQRLSRADIARKVDWALSLVRLTGFKDRKPDMLSGGQQQRVALARALVFDPCALLMDEPLAALDRSLREEIQEELREIHNRLGTTIVYVTHDQEEAMRMSDRIAVLRAGSIEQLDEARKLYDAPKNEYVATFMGKSNLFRGVIIERNETEIVIRAKHGIFRVNAAGKTSLPVGLRVVVAVRPEKVRILAGEAGCENHALGRVDKVTYLGGEIQYEVSAWDTRVLLRTTSAALMHEPGHGDTVKIGWSARDAAGVYPDETC